MFARPDPLLIVCFVINHYSCLSFHVALICTAWCHPHVYMGLIHVPAFPAPVSLQRPSSSLRLVDCWDGAIVTCVEWPQASTTCPPSEWLSSRPLMFELSPSTCESNAVWILNTPFYRNFHQILYLLNMLMTGLWLYIPFFVSWPLPIRPVSHLWPHFTLCVQVSGSFSTSLIPNPLINGMLFFKLHKRPAY